jgi:hypothetical protein
MSGKMVMRIDLGVFGEIHELSCDVDPRMKITGSGNLSVDSINKTPGPDPNCATVIVECNLPWPGSGEEDGPAGVLQGGINICIDPSDTDINNCTGTLAMSLSRAQTTPGPRRSTMQSSAFASSIPIWPWNMRQRATWRFTSTTRSRSAPDPRGGAGAFADPYGLARVPHVCELALFEVLEPW